MSKTKQPRNYHAQNAWFRSAAGPIKSKRKEQERKECRKFKHSKDD